MSISLVISLCFFSQANAEDTMPASLGSDETRTDAYLLKFFDNNATTANANGYQLTDFGDGSKRSVRRYSAVLPFCDSVYVFGCIQSIEAKEVSASQWEVLTPGQKFWNAPVASFTPKKDGSRTEHLWSTWVGSEEIGLPPSAKVQMFDSKLYQHGGGASYVVKALMYGNEQNAGRFTTLKFGLSIIPAKVLRYDPTVPGSQEIFSVENYRFPKNIEFRFTLKMGSLYSQLNGWFFGRVADAQIELNASKQTLTVRGGPSVTPVQTGYMPYPAPEPFASSFITQPNPYNGKLPSYSISPSNSNSVDSWLKYKNFLNVNASFENEVWQLDAAPKSSLDVNQDFEKCLSDKSGITGLLTTNATAYETNPPKWSSKDATLTYQVAGPGLLSDGTKNLGSYLLAIRTDVASCLWKTDLKNARATVEVTNGDGSTGAQLATTTISQRNGWLYFSASGFHFSAPTIKVKLSAEKTLKITCVKGKIKKIVNGSNPKCPSGYKKS
jgi:hypothetical protein